MDKYPQESIGEVYKVVEIMGVTSEEKAELVDYQLKGVAQVWFHTTEDQKSWWESYWMEVLKATFLDRFFPLREAKMMEFINLKGIHDVSCGYIIW